MYSEGRRIQGSTNWSFRTFKEAKKMVKPSDKKEESKQEVNNTKNLFLGSLDSEKLDDYFAFSLEGLIRKRR